MKRVLTYLYISCGLSIVAGLVFRLLHFGLPQKVVFDEVYFPVFANDMLHGQIDFDAHPPLGKAIMAIGIKLFGFNYFGDRIVVLLFGLGLIALLYFLGRRYYESQIGGLLMATFAALDCMLIVYSRLGLMDSILLFFVFATFLMSLKATKTWHFIVLGLLLGACPSIKWLAIAVIVPVAYVLWRRKFLIQFIAVLPLAVMVYCATIFAGGMLQHSQSLWDYFVWWHTSVWGYETTLKATHPWGSVWWTWPFMNRPLLMMRDTNPNGSQDVINAIGNPLLWYASGVAVLLSIGEIIADLWRRRPVLDNPTVPLLLGWGTFLFGWIPVTRVLFIYHYLPSYGFALMLLVYWLLRLWKVRPWLVILFVLVALALTCFFYPELVGWIPLTPHELQMRVWATGWI